MRDQVVSHPKAHELVYMTNIIVKFIQEDFSTRMHKLKKTELTAQTYKSLVNRVIWIRTRTK
jgi:hypothetical protein